MACGSKSSRNTSLIVTSSTVAPRTKEEKQIIERALDDLTAKSDQEKLFEQVHQHIEDRVKNMLGAKNTPTLRARIRREAIELAEDLIGPKLAEQIEVQVDPLDPTHVKISIPYPSVPLRGFDDSDW